MVGVTGADRLHFEGIPIGTAGACQPSLMCFGAPLPPPSAPRHRTGMTTSFCPLAHLADLVDDRDRAAFEADTAALATANRRVTAALLDFFRSSNGGSDALERAVRLAATL